MKILKSYAQGIKEATLRPKMAGVLWLVNFLFGSVICFLFSSLFSQVFGRSAAAESLLQKFDFNILSEILAHRGESVQMIFLTAFVLTALYFAVSIFLHGGILFSLKSPRKSGALKRRDKRFAAVFFQGAGRFSGRFFRLFLYSLPLWGIFILLNVLIFGFFRVVTAGGIREQLAYYLIWARIAIALFLLVLLRMILDYARIRIVLEDTAKVLKSLLKTLKFIFQQFGKALGLYSLLVLTGALVFGLLFAATSHLPSHSLLTLLLSLFIGQVFIAARSWTKIAFQAAQLAFAKEAKPFKKIISNPTQKTSAEGNGLEQRKEERR